MSCTSRYGFVKNKVQAKCGLIGERICDDSKGVNTPRPAFQLSREQIVAAGDKLAPAAVTLARLRPLLADPNTELDEIVNLIRLDPAMTVHVVRLSNSILFGTYQNIDTLEGAVGRVGFMEIYRLVGLAAGRQICQRDLATYRLTATRLWENSVATAAAAEVLALPAGVESGLSYAAGLLRNVGKVVIDACAPGLVYPGEAEWPRVSEWEKKCFGLTSEEVTVMLLEHWRLPAGVIDAIRAHHDPLADEVSNIGACVLNLACGVTRRFGLDLPGETPHWERSEAKLALGGVTDLALEQCTENAHAHYLALCSTLG